MELSKKFIQDRKVLLLIAAIMALLVIGVSIVLLRFDISKNPTTIISYRPNISGASYQSGKPADIYLLAVYMLATAVMGIILGAKTYKIRRSLSHFLLGSTAFLLLLSALVANSLISLQ